MIIDSQLEFSDAQAITATATSTNVIDFINEGASRSMNDQLWLCVDVTADAAFNTLTSLDIGLFTHTAAAVESGHVVSTQNFVLAELIAGQRLIRIKLPQRFYNSTDNVYQGLEQYVGMVYTVNGTDPTTGSLNAYLTDCIDAPINELS